METRTNGKFRLGRRKNKTRFIEKILATVAFGSIEKAIPRIFIMAEILTERQQILLGLLSNQTSITDFFYLTGGTALAEFYLRHRYSEDLDFFSETEIEPQAVFTMLKTIKKVAGYSEVEYQQTFKRNLFFLHYPEEVIKTEFTLFPFPKIEVGSRIGGLSVDSLRDIAVNKLFTIYQKPRSRDFIDLYLILKEKGWTIADLIKLAKIKFDTHLDLVQLGSRLLQVHVVKDYPRMVIQIEPEEWQEYFLKEAKKFEKGILEG